MNMQKMMENMEEQSAEYQKVFGTQTPQTFVSARTTEGDMLVMKAHQAARKAIKEIYPQIQVGVTLSLHDIQARAGGESFAAKEWDEDDCGIGDPYDWRNQHNYLDIWLGIVYGRIRADCFYAKCISV